MAKTAEEILKEGMYSGIADNTPERVIVDITGVQGLSGQHTPMEYGECLKCMQEWGNQCAAQEVEAYKERLRMAMKSAYENSTYTTAPASYSNCIRLIDAVK